MHGAKFRRCKELNLPFVWTGNRWLADKDFRVSRGLAQTAIKSAIGNYEVDNGFYPKSLQDLLQQPSNAKNWHGPYLDKLPQDPWGNNYIYYYPGKHNQSSYDLLSVGPDAKEGTDDDVVSWTK